MIDTLREPLQGNRCWSTIGVWGDHSCPELKEWVHCQNCPVLTKGGRALFDQPPPRDYLQDWGKLLASEGDERAQVKSSVLVFRLGVERLALPADTFQSVEEPRPIHRIPHRSNKVLLGLVNIRGALQLCISLTDMLGIESKEGGQDRKSLFNQKRLAVVHRGGEHWAFPVDEALGIQRYHVDEVKTPPVTLVKGAASFTKGVLSLPSINIGILDEELLFYHLKRNALG